MQVIEKSQTNQQSSAWNSLPSCKLCVCHKWPNDACRNLYPIQQRRWDCDPPQEYSIVLSLNHATRGSYVTKQEALVPKGNWNLSQHRASDIICTAILPTHFFCICVFIQFIFWFPFAKFASETSLSWFLFWNQSPATSSNWIRTKKREQAKKDKLNVWEMSAKPMCPQAWNWSCWWLQGKIFHFSSTLQHVKGKASKHFRKKILIKANFKLEPLRPKLGQAS